MAVRSAWPAWTSNHSATPRSKAGDYLDMRAEMEVIAAVSNCPSEHNPCNGWNPTPLRVIIYQP